MKNLYALLIAGSTAIGAYAQSQRLVLVEEFTQASCGPCAAANPAFNTLLNNNAAKAVSIKYQVSWPGVDPMNAQYPSGVSSRVNYYGLNSVPYAILDGEAVTGSSYTGYPGNCTQAKIDAAYAVPSPFTVDVSHYLNAANDSIFITATITATQSYTGVNYIRGHLVMVEKHIDFSSPPGSNGETDFYGVCRRMYPTQAGTPLPLTWNPGDDSTIQIAAAIPSYIYNINEIAIVCFVQDNGTKEVLQAGYSSSPVGIQTFTGAPSSINLFPNPAAENVKLSFTLEEQAEVSVNIYDALGQLIRAENKGAYAAGKQEIAISIEMLANGMYVVELVADNRRTTTQLNVQH